MEYIVLKIVLAVSYMALEYWLGKTDKIKAGSVIETAIDLVKNIKK
jgi:hypothetical protein